MEFFSKMLNLTLVSPLFICLAYHFHICSRMRLQNANDTKKNKEVVLGESHLRAGMKESGESYLKGKVTLPGERTLSLRNTIS